MVNPLTSHVQTRVLSHTSPVQTFIFKLMILGPLNNAQTGLTAADCGVWLRFPLPTLLVIDSAHFANFNEVGSVFSFKILHDHRL